MKAWVPGTPRPVLAHAEGTEHTLELDWVRQGGSLEDLTDHSALIIRGQLELKTAAGGTVAQGTLPVLSAIAVPPPRGAFTA